ncbi:hypothetical protein E1B28_005675 [Marasmius oreades]|uniref:Uncharacterized protein n=1 Tax=Marasmius oreades TaxID=181124 RepID=A0A9P7S466_9AGAR|nr:uncharacterized protein E1B28_005675 [Marasmius oreades]KAG7094868.1 hypothetical protein E1B28_005675 [Marasmius oreades]
MRSNRRRSLYKRTQTNSPRQLPPTITSSFNWWPYPSWGATTTSTPAQAIATITTTVLPIQPATSTTATPEVLSSSLIAPSIATPVSSNSSSSIGSSITSPPSDSHGITTITGTRDSQSGAPSTVVEYPKVHPASNNQNLNMILIPVFIVLGLVVGSVIAWFAYGCFTRKPERRRRRSELEVGPAYCPSSLSSKGTGSIQEKIPLSGGERCDDRDAASDDGHSWHALDVNDDHDAIPTDERAAFLGGPHPVNPGYLAPLPATRKPQSSTQGLSRAKTGTSVSVYSQLNDDDEFDEVSFMGESTFDPRSPRVPLSTSPPKKKEQALNPDSMRRAPTTATTTTMASSDTRTVSLSRRRPTCSRVDTTSSADERKSVKDLSRANTAKTTKTTRTTNTTTTTTTRSGANTAMSFRIVEESPLPTPLHSPPAIDASGFSWAGVGEMLWGNGEGNRNGGGSDRYTNLPDRGGRSPVKKRSLGSTMSGGGDGASTRTGRTRGKSVTTAGERSSRPVSRAGSSEGEQGQERRLRDYYGHGGPHSHSHHKLPQSPPQVTSPKLEGDLCFSPALGR